MPPNSQGTVGRISCRWHTKDSACCSLGSRSRANQMQRTIHRNGGGRGRTLRRLGKKRSRKQKKKMSRKVPKKEHAKWKARIQGRCQQQQRGEFNAPNIAAVKASLTRLSRNDLKRLISVLQTVVDRATFA